MSKHIKHLRRREFKWNSEWINVEQFLCTIFKWTRWNGATVKLSFLFYNLFYIMKNLKNLYFIFFYKSDIMNSSDTILKNKKMLWKLLNYEHFKNYKTREVSE